MTYFLLRWRVPLNVRQAGYGALAAVVLLLFVNESADAQLLKRLPYEVGNPLAISGNWAWAETQFDFEEDFDGKSDSGVTSARAMPNIAKAILGLNESEIQNSASAEATDGSTKGQIVSVSASATGTATGNVFNVREGAGYNATNVNSVHAKYQVVAQPGNPRRRAKLLMNLNVSGSTTSSCGGQPRIIAYGLIKVNGTELTQFVAFDDDPYISFSVTPYRGEEFETIGGAIQFDVGSEIVDVGDIVEVILYGAHHDLHALAGVFFGGLPCPTGNASLRYNASYYLRLVDPKFNPKPIQIIGLDGIDLP